MDIAEKIRTREFQNWMKCISAQNDTRKALCEVVEARWKGFISCLDDQEREQIETFLKCVKCANIKYLKKDEKQFCNHSACALLLQKLLKLLQKNTFVPDIYHQFNVPTSDLCYFLYWDIGKLFLFVEQEIEPEAGLKGLDICDLLKMMNACQLFAFEGSSEAYKSICGDRDELIHTGDCSISDATRQTMAKNMSNVLSHFCEGRLRKCTDVLSNIQQNETTDWLNEYKFEYPRIARQMLECKVAALKKEISIRKSKPLEDILKETEILLHKVNESISIEESEKEHDELMEIENCKGKNWPQEDKTELLCKTTQEIAPLMDNEGENERKIMMEDKEMAEQEESRLVMETEQNEAQESNAKIFETRSDKNRKCVEELQQMVEEKQEYITKQEEKMKDMSDKYMKQINFCEQQITILHEVKDYQRMEFQKIIQELVEDHVKKEIKNEKRLAKLLEEERKRTEQRMKIELENTEARFGFAKEQASEKELRE